MDIEIGKLGCWQVLLGRCVLQLWKSECLPAVVSFLCFCTPLSNTFSQENPKRGSCSMVCQIIFLPHFRSRRPNKNPNLVEHNNVACTGCRDCRQQILSIDIEDCGAGKFCWAMCYSTWKGLSCPKLRPPKSQANKRTKTRSHVKRQIRKQIGNNNDTI